MNRIFHARISWYQYLFLLLLGILAFFLVWDKMILPATACAILLIILIERFIHTTYTVTADRQLILSAGRFSRVRTIRIADILSIQRRSSVKIGTFAVLNYLLIRYGKDKYISVMPVKEQEFIKLIEEKKETTFYKE